MAEQLGIGFIETSSSNGENVELMFTMICQMILAEINHESDIGERVGSMLNRKWNESQEGEEGRLLLSISYRINIAACL